jgi:hypothetical protein
VMAVRTRDARAIRTITILAVLGAIVIYWTFGTLSPCGVLRESARQRDGLAAVLPDDIVDLAIAAQYGEMSQGRCMAILMNEAIAGKRDRTSR